MIWKVKELDTSVKFYFINFFAMVLKIILNHLDYLCLEYLYFLALSIYKNKTFIYMFHLADQTAVPNGLTFFVDTHGLKN